MVDFIKILEENEVGDGFIANFYENEYFQGTPIIVP